LTVVRRSRSIGAVSMGFPDHEELLVERIDDGSIDYRYTDLAESPAILKEVPPTIAPGTEGFRLVAAERLVADRAPRHVLARLAAG
jgi:hypothetical protein